MNYAEVLMTGCWLDQQALLGELDVAAIDTGYNWLMQSYCTKLNLATKARVYTDFVNPSC